jgi:hypothetical protein
MGLADARRKSRLWRLDENIDQAAQLDRLKPAGSVNEELTANRPASSKSGEIFSRQMVQKTGQAQKVELSHSIESRKRGIPIALVILKHDVEEKTQLENLHREGFFNCNGNHD